MNDLLQMKNSEKPKFAKMWLHSEKHQSINLSEAGTKS